MSSLQKLKRIVASLLHVDTIHLRMICDKTGPGIMAGKEGLESTSRSLKDRR